MVGKIEKANIQQAFVLNATMELIPKKSQILCVGAHADPVPITLRALGYSVISIDPTFNYSLAEYKAQDPGCFGGIISTSVIEHVQDDEQFISDICALLAPGGLAILTCDFLDSFKAGDPVPLTALRLYTSHDIQIRLRTVMARSNTYIYGECDYTGRDNFEHNGCSYSFASFLMRKS
jgi:SAM-dependent methyltransferase